MSLETLKGLWHCRKKPLERGCFRTNSRGPFLALHFHPKNPSLFKLPQYAPRHHSQQSQPRTKAHSREEEQGRRNGFVRRTKRESLAYPERFLFRLALQCVIGSLFNARKPFVRIGAFTALPDALSLFEHRSKRVVGKHFLILSPVPLNAD